MRLSPPVSRTASPDYDAHVTYTWAMNLRLRPSCFLVPQSAAELSTGLTSLLGVEAGRRDIAVRIGGHGGIPGMSGTASAASCSAVASRTTRAVLGMGCDSVVNYEVVLANGSVVNANVSSHGDLFRALKGGGGNFGVVTRFDVRAIEGADLWYDRRMMAPDRSDAVADMLVKFADQNRTWISRISRLPLGKIWEERSWKGRTCILLLIALTPETISYRLSASLPPLVP